MSILGSSEIASDKFFAIPSKIFLGIPIISYKKKLTHLTDDKGI